MKRTWKQIGSLFLSVCMVVTMLPVTAFAETNVTDSGAGLGTSGKITAFADLDESVAAQTVDSGTEENELNLPTELTATVTRTVATTAGSAVTATVSGNDTAMDSEAQEPEPQEETKTEEITEEITEETTVDVSGWTSDPEYSPEYDAEGNNSYVFTPALDLPDNLTLAEGVSAPTATVTVGDYVEEGRYSSRAAAGTATGGMNIGGEAGLDLASNHSGTGWEWDASAAALTLKSGYGTDSIEINCLVSDNIELIVSDNVTLHGVFNCGIKVDGSLSIRVEDSYVLTAISDDWDGILAEGISFKAGKVIAQGGGVGVNTNLGSGDIIIEGNASLTASGASISGDPYWSYNGIQASYGNVIINTSGEVTVSGGKGGIYADKVLSILQGKINVNGMLFSMYSNEGVNIIGGEVITNDMMDKNGDVVTGTELSVSGNSTVVTINGNINKDFFYGVGGNLKVSAGTVTVSGTVYGDTEHTGGVLNGSLVPGWHSITVIGGMADVYGAKEGTQVSIYAFPAGSSERFKEWTVVSGGMLLADATADSTSFIMPDEEVAVKANYENTTPVSGVSLNLTGLSLYSNASPGTANLTAAVAPEDATIKTVLWQSNSPSVATVDTSGKVRAVSNGTAVITATTIDGSYSASCTVTVTTYSSRNSGGNGGGSSSGSSTSSPAAIAEPEKQPSQPVTAAAPVTAATGTNDSAHASIPEKSVTDAIAKAQANAKAQGKTANGTTVALNVTMPKGATSLTAELTRNSLNSLISSGVTSLELNGSPVTVSFNTQALAEIQKQSSGNISITIAPNASLSSAAKTMIGTRPVYDLTVSYAKEGKNATVTSFGGGTATVSVPYTPAKGEAVGSLYAVYVDGAGNATRIAGSAYDANIGCVMFTTTHFSLYGIGYTAPSAKFTDIANYWAKESIDYVVGRGLLSGTTETAFAPDTAMTRGMLAAALGRLANVDTKAYTTNSFTDVALGSAYQPYIEWAYKKCIVQDTAGGKFEPDRTITREEIAVIFSRYAKITGYTLPVTRTATTYADASSIGSTYKTAVTAMQQAGIMMGGTGGKFNPKSNATRAEVSSILQRYIKLTIDPATAQGWALNDAGQYLYYKDSKALTGTQTIGGVKYFLGTDGTLKTGWVKDDAGNWRFYSGNIMLVGFWDLGANGESKRYYFTKDGVMVAGKWLEIDGKWYYFNTGGSLAKSTKINEYEVDENGVRKSK